VTDRERCIEGLCPKHMSCDYCHCQPQWVKELREKRKNDPHGKRPKR